MKKDYTDSCISIKASYLLRKVIRMGGSSNGSLHWTFNDDSEASVGYEADIYGKRCVRFWYSRNGEAFNYRVGVRNTRCHFGGFRFWFECPLSRDGKTCGRRVGVLYLDGNYFGCRTCHNLAYRSQNVGKRNAFDNFFRSYDILEEVEQLENALKRWTYRGKPTKKVLRIERLGQAAVAMHGHSLNLHLADRLSEEKL